MDKHYKVIFSNKSNHIYDKLLCSICNGVSTRTNFSKHKTSNKHLKVVEYNKNGGITDEEGNKIFLQPPTKHEKIDEKVENEENISESDIVSEGEEENYTEDEKEEETTYYFFKDLKPNIQKLLKLHRNDDIFDDDDEWFDLDNFLNHNLQIEHSFLDKIIKKI